MADPTYKLTISYDGTHYCGWQIQPNGVSIQELIQNALSTILRHEVAVIGAGRTDAGVHALGQVAHFRFNEKPLELSKILKSLNGLLPRDIRITGLQNVPSDFHSRYSAKTKTYRYYLHLDPVLDPFNRHFAHHVIHPFNRDALEIAKEHLIGTHDFTTFANEAHSGSAAKNPIRTIYSIDVHPTAKGIYLEFKGNGFLYKMVRNMVGTLLEIARGKMTPEEIPLLLEKKDRRLAAKAAPPTGLFLVDIEYP